mmetsp:Transcript_29471/g.52968  ORF Transcript_29471/g.52968 Transcript_29471/m.52968 type:complete len:215 (+) Transcript_29471:1063-1707(+)
MTSSVGGGPSNDKRCSESLESKDLQAFMDEASALASQCVGSQGSIGPAPKGPWDCADSGSEASRSASNSDSLRLCWGRVGIWDPNVAAAEKVFFDRSLVSDMVSCNAPLNELPNLLRVPFSFGFCGASPCPSSPPPVESGTQVASLSSPASAEDEPMNFPIGENAFPTPFLVALLAPLKVFPMLLKALPMPFMLNLSAFSLGCRSSISERSECP